MAGKFEIYKDRAGDFRFRLKASNGQTILSSEGYRSKSSAENGIRSVMENGGLKSRYEKSSTPAGLYRFSLTAKNNQVIGQSQNYKSTASRDSGIEAVGRAAKGAPTVDLTA
ncbi:MAG: YegP family protein [Gemmatimonadota bacterium]